MRDLGLDRWTAVAVATHDLEIDQEALAPALHSRAGYVGVLGSRRKLGERRAGLRDAGVGEADIARLHAPIGLAIDASAVACTYPSHESPSAPATTVATNTAVTAPRSIVARRLVVTSWRRLRSSDGVGGSLGGSGAVGAAIRLVFPPPCDLEIGRAACRGRVLPYV